MTNLVLRSPHEINILKSLREIKIQILAFNMKS